MYPPRKLTPRNQCSTLRANGMRLRFLMVRNEEFPWKLRETGDASGELKRTKFTANRRRTKIKTSEVAARTRPSSCPPSLRQGLSTLSGCHRGYTQALLPQKNAAGSRNRPRSAYPMVCQAFKNQETIIRVTSSIYPSSVRTVCTFRGPTNEELSRSQNEAPSAGAALLGPVSKD